VQAPQTGPFWGRRYGMTNRVDLERLIGETHNRTPSPRQSFLALGHPGMLLARISFFETVASDKLRVVSYKNKS
jgi:hypothetical protein